MDMITALLSIIILATLVQFLVDVIKGWLPSKALEIFTPPIIAALLGVAMALVFQIDVFELAGYSSSIPYFSNVLTGIILSAGSTAIHELIAKLRSSRADLFY